jgi:glutaredoxin
MQADLRAARQIDFYQQTLKKMQEKDTGNADMSRRLKDAELDAKKAADAKGPKEVVLGDGGKGDKRPTTAQAKPEAESPQPAYDVTDELNSILKMSPSMSPFALGYSRAWRSNAGRRARVVIIFSKSYCPFSKKAKGILLDKYKIVPAPYVVELDQHPHGSEIQDELQRTTGRRTVPNVLINGRSIGGGDDVAELDTSGHLVDKVRSIGGKRIMEAALRSMKHPKEEGL